MNKISCDICTDLIPLVKDDVASGDSKQAVLEHIKTCEDCRTLYGEDIKFEKNDSNIIRNIKKHLIKISLIIITLGILFGISLSANQFMFYNILILPSIGLLSYFSLKSKSIYVCFAIFILVYIRWFYHSFGYLLEGNMVQAFIPPLCWAVIYLCLTLLGIVIGFLLNFGFRKEHKHEENI